MSASVGIRRTASVIRGFGMVIGIGAVLLTVFGLANGAKDLISIVALLLGPGLIVWACCAALAWIVDGFATE